MCGLCGLVRPGPVGAAERALVERMTHLLAHRGPDGSGVWSGTRVVLGHRRLAVIDPAGSPQPMRDAGSGAVLVYNGEIYDYRRLRRDLEARGHAFVTSGDTEVVLRGYLEWGPAVVERLRGMFAFAVWDPRSDRLVLARDRLGVKPLYLARTRYGELVFGSEIKALLAHPGVPRELNSERLAEQLAFRMVAGPETLFLGVEELPPATVAVWEGGRLSQRTYWSPLREAREPDGDPVARCRELLIDAVDSRLVSDVPLGAITSGGVDSSLLSAIAAERRPGALDTFCVGVADPEWDERPHARRVSDRIGSDHHEAVLTPERVAADLDRLTWANDEPLHVPSSVGLCAVYRLAREEAGVTVLLSGEGADEVFGGYEWYRVMWRREQRLRPGLRTLARIAPPVGRAGRLRRLAGRDVLVAANAFAHPAAAAAAAGRPGADLLAHRRALWPRGRAHRSDLFVFDQRTYLQLALQRQDRMSMAAAVEAREPFLDHPLVEWANGLGTIRRLPGGRAKGLLKDAAARWLPPDIIDRPKNGFSVPFADWVRPGGVLADRVRALSEPSGPLSGRTDPAVVRRIADEHARGAADHRTLLWSLVALDAWARVFLGPAPRPQSLSGAAV